MSFLLVNREDALIDSYRPQTDYSSQTVTQADNPGTDPMPVGSAKVAALPDPAIGGMNGSGYRNGYSTGFRGISSKLAPFTGAMAKPPAITNPVIGEVGRSGRASRLYAGVMDQLTNYEPSEIQSSIRYVTADKG